MLKKVVNTVTMLLVGFGFSVVSTKASPHVNTKEVSPNVEVSRAVDAARVHARGFVALVDHNVLVEAVDESLSVNERHVRVHDRKVSEHVGHEETVRFVGDNVDGLRGFVTKRNLHTGFDVSDKDDHFYLNDLCNVSKVAGHPSGQSHLALQYSRRVSVLRQVGDVSFDRRADSSQKVPALETVTVFKNLTGDNDLSVPSGTPFKMTDVSTLRHEGVSVVSPLVQADATGSGGEVFFVA